MASIKVALVDDQDLFREGLSVFTRKQAELELVGATSSAAWARTLVAALRPDVMIIGVALHGDDGIAFADEITAISPETGILILTMDVANPVVARILAWSAAGFALKSQPVEEILDAIRAVAHGGEYVPVEYAHLRHALRASRGS